MGSSQPGGSYPHKQDCCKGLCRHGVKEIALNPQYPILTFIFFFPSRQIKQLTNQICSVWGCIGLHDLLGLGLSHSIPKINRAEVSRYTQESCKYFWELTLQGRDKSWECSVLPQPPPTHLFGAKIPPQRARQLRSERRPSSSSAHGDEGQRCWAWHQESTSLLSVAAPSRGAAQTSQIPALLPHMLPQLLPT